ncbi:MAG: polyprenol monophosphomannose synthase [bacterium]|nr:polyprenol monophosphomannose synthase [bacterium]
MARIYVVTPTYNEQGNLPILAEKIFALKIPDLHLMVIDDNSPDGTGKIADELRQKYPISVIHREKKSGLGKAYAQGFQSLPPETEIVIQMDADLSHDPAVIPAMLEKINSSAGSGQVPCDLVLGSRYVPGGKIENWNLIRRMISRFGNFYARTILGLPYRDLTGGFKCFRREVLKTIQLDSLSSTGYNFQIETTYAAHKKGFKICEVPITFAERKTGKSKFNLRIILESFWKVLTLRFRN